MSPQPPKPAKDDSELDQLLERLAASEIAAWVRELQRQLHP